LRDFALFKTAVGTIDFNEDLLVQVFSQYPGKILRANFNIGDDVKVGDILFTIDSPDLLQSESTLLASAGVLELQKRVLARATMLLKAGGSAQKDVDQSTSDQQTAEGNFKAAKDSVRIFGKSDEEIEQILLARKVDSTLVVPSPISGRVVARNAAPGFLTQPGNAPAPIQSRICRQCGCWRTSSKQMRRLTSSVRTSRSEYPHILTPSSKGALRR
jgi:cobalt-zinc-cadmium efflux system membrane fusion protein